ncbi:hypothetical protein R5R35_000647 [Gryllus longicercus]|uniref:Hexosyltransferase n=1 Tax=Gryllus longicercus TaxID=2509291 RepID=A0AAN9W3H3_9ORTH
MCRGRAGRALALAGAGAGAWLLFVLADAWLPHARPAPGPRSTGGGGEAEEPLLAEGRLALEPAPCGGGATALVAVVSHAAHFAARDAQRRAWPDAELAALGACRVFLLARPPLRSPPAPAPAVHDALRDEQRRHGDLLQGDWAEGYRLLLRKHLLALRWLVRCCARAHLLLKMDDDVAADVPWLLEHARRHLRGREGQAVLLGHVLAGAAPQRAPGDKWRLSREEFAADAFPRFVSGWAYVATAAAASALLRIVDSAARPAPLWIDDVYITGVLAETAGVPRWDLPRPFAADAALLRCCLRAPALRCDFAAAPDGGEPALVAAAAAHARRCARAGPARCPARAPARALNRTCVRALQPGHARPLPADAPADASVRPVSLR